MRILSLLFVLPFLFLTSYSAPVRVLSHSSVDSLAPRGVWGSVKNLFKQNPAPRLGRVVKVVPKGAGPHPAIVTDHKGDDVAVAQVSHKLPPKLYKHKGSTADVVPNAKLDPTSDINTGKPDWYHKSKVKPYKGSRKASILETLKLKFLQRKNT